MIPTLVDQSKRRAEEARRRREGERSERVRDEQQGMWPRATIVGEIHRERDAQDAQWGGPEHDDAHYPGEWIGFIEDQVRRYREEIIDNQSVNIARRRLIKIAALAVAAIESIDRKRSQP